MLALEADGWKQDKIMSGGCRSYLGLNGKRLFVGCNGSLRFGSNRSTSRPVNETTKRMMIEKGQELYRIQSQPLTNL